MELLHLILLLTTWLTLHVTSYPLEDHQVPNTTNPLIRRHCVWIPALKQYDCNEFLPTSAQMAWHMRDIKGDGMVGPDSRLIFYANLFPAVADGLNPQQIQQMSEWCVGWMRRNGITAATCKYPPTPFSRAAAECRCSCANTRVIRVGQATKTKAWIDYSTNYIADGPHKQDFIDKWGGVDTAQELLGNCWIQAFALSAIFEDVYFFTAHDSQVKDSSSYWIQAERWVLTRPGGSAKRIWQVDVSFSL